MKDLRITGPTYKRPVNIDYGGEGITLTFLVDSKFNVKSFFEVLNEKLQFLPQGFVTSAEKKTGTDEVLACIDQYNKLVAEG